MGETDRPFGGEPGNAQRLEAALGKRMADLTLKAVADEIDELWAIKDIAAFGKWHPVYVQQAIVVLPDFPKPLRITGPNAKPRWVAGHVRRR